MPHFVLVFIITYVVRCIHKIKKQGTNNWSLKSQNQCRMMPIGRTVKCNWPVSQFLINRAFQII